MDQNFIFNFREVIKNETMSFENSVDFFSNGITKAAI